ncbi:CaiB/BaiF CoA transferase family protein [Solimonas terrae]|uniref:CoA transferase n=1 Tax=Solimonas terrae TaxID=1396819 RepID=A0A6M2BM36_9GAMM|nr:CoA transferase [Solimonas terrae]NGY03380.1 CoA transferase [Solimonas terrae]
MSALKGYRVLELADGVGGEYCGKLLADFGAEVIKIERPGRGSATRDLAPFAPGVAGPERSGLFAYLNTGKRSVTLDLDSAASGATLAPLLDRVDAVIDDHPAGWLAAIGLDPAQLDTRHPALVLCTVTPFGQSAPPERRHAEDLNVMHASGWAYHTPSGSPPDAPPLKGAGRFMASYEAALDAALCIVAALYERETSGRGRFIDISKQEVLASRVDYVLGQMVAGDMDVSTSRTSFDLFGPAGIFACRDGYAYIWMSAPTHWDALRKLLGDPAWMNDFPERWLERACTPERVAQCREHIAAWLKTQDKEEVAAQAQQLGLTLVPVNDVRDLHASAQFAFRGYFTEVEHPQLRRARYPTVPYRLAATPARIDAAAPLLGAHTDAVLASLQETAR